MDKEGVLLPICLYLLKTKQEDKKNNLADTDFQMSIPLFWHKIYHIQSTLNHLFEQQFHLL